MPHAILDIVLLPKGRNVRSGPIVGRSLGCEVVIDGALYAVRFELKPGQAIALGSRVQLEATFEDPEAALQRLSVGKTVTLWDHGAIGEGTVVKTGSPAS